MKIALHPLQWLSTPDGWMDFSQGPPLAELLDEVARAGFRAITAAPPPGMAIADYKTALDRAGLAPAPGYFSSPLDDPATHAETAKRAERIAEQHAALGLTEVVTGAKMDPAAPRVARPVEGVEADDARLAVIAKGLTAIGEATRRHGVTTCLHQHVGGWVETEQEVDWLLDRVEPELLSLAPDIGHLAWAGIDPADFVRRHRDRIGVVHVKDMRHDVAASGRAEGRRYQDIVLGGLWAEPGRGDLDLGAAFAALPESFDGWVEIEIDRPDLATPAESVRFCGRWAREAESWRPSATQGATT